METKLNLKKQTINALEELIEVNLDSSKILAEASDAVEGTAMTNLFGRVSKTRHSHADELRGYVRINEVENEEEGSFASAARKQWLKFRAALNGGDPQVVLIEAERAEDVIKAEYESLLKETAGSAMNDVLMRQYREVKHHHDLIRDLRDNVRAAA